MNNFHGVLLQSLDTQLRCFVSLNHRLGHAGAEQQQRVAEAQPLARLTVMLMFKHGEHFHDFGCLPIITTRQAGCFRLLSSC
jgi:hypothetical protein